MRARQKRPPFMSISPFHARFHDFDKRILRAAFPTFSSSGCDFELAKNVGAREKKGGL